MEIVFAELSLQPLHQLSFSHACSTLDFAILHPEAWAKQISSAVLDVDGLPGL